MNNVSSQPDSFKMPCSRASEIMNAEYEKSLMLAYLRILARHINLSVQLRCMPRFVHRSAEAMGFAMLNVVIDKPTWAPDFALNSMTVLDK